MHLRSWIATMIAVALPKEAVGGRLRICTTARLCPASAVHLPHNDVSDLFFQLPIA
jgi:hypothetical protein